MKYYKYMTDGRVAFIQQTNEVLNDENATEITNDEYISLGGYAYVGKQPDEELQEIVKVGIRVGAQEVKNGSQDNSIESCETSILDMTMKLYLIQ